MCKNEQAERKGGDEESLGGKLIQLLSRRGGKPTGIQVDLIDGTTVGRMSSSLPDRGAAKPEVSKKMGV
jgi:hypothetical protein